MVYGKTIELFLVNGTADSLVTAELSNWNGKAIKIPRIEVGSCNRDDIKIPGVYFLFCKEDDGKDSVYIGEAENVKERLERHLKDYQSEKEKFYDVGVKNFENKRRSPLQNALCFASLTRTVSIAKK